MDLVDVVILFGILFVVSIPVSVLIHLMHKQFQYEQKRDEEKMEEVWNLKN